ncbi:MAG: DUF4145 domain-containing protein [Coprobacillus sp.]
MSQSYTCTYCNHTFPLIDSTHTNRHPSFENGLDGFNMGSRVTYESEVSLIFYKCPNCGEYTIFAVGTGDKVKNINCHIKPNSLAKQFPSYIPEQIRQDYEEAYAIVDLSSKSSATLARRCLQGMIHDFWGIHEKNLNAEITSLQNKIPTTQWKVLDGIRKLGNIGAHMENDINVIIDIDPNEASKLLKVIEKLMNDWYIERHETEKLYADIIEISDDKQTQRKGK